MALVAVGLSKTYRGAEGSVVALRPAGLCVERGEFVALMGRSGSGKSTLLRLAGGAEAADEGMLTVDGDRIVSRAQRAGLRRGRVAMVQQDYNLVPELSLVENIELAQWLVGRKPLSPGEALAVVGLEGLGRRLPRDTSGGEQQRAAIARALAVDAGYILADEPSAALDEDNAVRVCEALRAAAEAGAGVLVATHDPVVASRADVCWHIDRGVLETA